MKEIQIFFLFFIFFVIKRSKPLRPSAVVWSRRDVPSPGLQREGRALLSVLPSFGTSPVGRERTGSTDASSQLAFPN